MTDDTNKISKTSAMLPFGLADDPPPVSLHGCKTVVVGCGVIGLSLADALRRAGADVVVVADRTPLQTTSAVAAGLIEPVAGTSDPVGAALELAAFDSAYKVWRRRAQVSDLVIERKVVHYAQGRTGPLPWHSSVADYRELEPFERHPLYTDYDAASYTTFVVDTPAWLQAAQHDLATRGVTFTRRRVDSLEFDCHLVVNATGLGAARLADDSDVFRGDGHVVYVRRPTDVTDVLMEETRTEEAMVHETLPVEMRYVIPRVGDVVLGGTLIDSWDVTNEPEPWPEIAARILELAIDVEPRLAGAEVLGYRAAARPRRLNGTRLELQTKGPAVPILHCYGSGGSGWTLAPGLTGMAMALVSAARADGIIKTVTQLHPPREGAAS